MNSEKANGMMDKVAGKAQEIAGDVSGNERWQAEGVTRQAVGALQEKYGDALSCAGSMMKKNPLAALALLPAQVCWPACCCVAVD